MGKITMVFLFTFAFVGSELVSSGLYWLFLFLLTVALIANLVLVQYDTGRVIAFWITVVLLVIVYVFDFFWSSSPKEKSVFYIPMFLELLLLLFGFLLYAFSIPERWCTSVRFFQLYTTGYIFFTLFLINFYFEASRILYYTIKLNSGYFDEDEDDWYHMENVYHK